MFATRVLSPSDVHHRFSYPFDEVGEFSVWCGYLFQGGAQLEPAACYDVGAVQPIPTMGEWSLIILLMIMMITGVIYFRTTSTNQLAVK